MYFDAEGRAFPAAWRIGNRPRWAHLTAERLSGCLRRNPLRFCNDYQIAETDAPDRFAWTSVNPALGALKGAFEIAGKAIFSHYVAENGLYSGQETLLFQDARTYENAGIAFCGGRRLSAWTAVLRAVDGA